MSDGDDIVPRWRTRRIILGLILFVAALGGAVLLRSVRPDRDAGQPSGRTTTAAPRPIVQFVRQQAGLPDLSDVVARLCPSVAIIVPRGQDPAARGAAAAAAFAYSGDGWLVTSASGLPEGALDAVFGDGQRSQISEVRPDPVSGLAVVRAPATAPLNFSDQPFPRVGQSGLSLTTPVGQGCSASMTMIGSDFIADGGSGVSYARLSPPPERWSAGVPLLGSDGLVIGVGVDGVSGGMIPVPIAEAVLDELIRNSPSASVSFGFRAVDFGGAIAARLGDARSGASVALVQADSPATRAGLQAGDVVTAVGDDPVSSASELSRMLDGVSGKVTLTVQRRAQTLSVTLRAPGGR